MTATPSIRFSVHRAGAPAEELSFERPVISVGKLSTSTLRLDDASVSRRHAVVEQLPGSGWRITDLGSTNGTLLNGEAVVQAPLRDGDRLTFGATSIVAHLGQAATPRLPTPPPLPRAGAVDMGGMKPTHFYATQPRPDSEHPHGVEVALLWGETVLAVETFRSPQVVAIGEAAGCRFSLPQERIGERRCELLVVRDGGFALNLSNPKLRGDVLVGGQVRPVADLRATAADAVLPLAEPLRARILLGEFTLLVTHGPVPRRTGVGHLGEPDLDAWIYIAVSAIVHVAFLLVLSHLPEDMRLSERDPRALKDRAIQVLRVEPEAPKDHAVEPPPVDEGRVPRDAGEAPDALTVHASPAPMEVPVQHPSEVVDRLQLERQRDREAFERMSVAERRAEAAHRVQVTATDQVFRESGLFDDLLQTEGPDAEPKRLRFAALTSRGEASDFQGALFDPFGGGGPTADGGLQLTSGPTPGGPAGGPAIQGGPGRVRGPARLPALAERGIAPRIIQGDPILRGELDAATIQRHVRRQLAGITWCYRDRLQVRRDLEGKLSLAFTILPNGTVLNPRTRDNTLDDPALAACIRTKMARWTFPSPKDGGVVEVERYPLILKRP